LTSLKVHQCSKEMPPLIDRNEKKIKLDYIE